MTQSRRTFPAPQEVAATNTRNFRTFLLMQQFAANEIGARIEQARKEKGLTQEELADLAAGFSKRSLQDYEAGVTIPYKHLHELGRLLKKPEEWFLYGDDEQEDAGGPSDERLREIVREELREIRQVLERIEGHRSNGEGGTGEEKAS